MPDFLRYTPNTPSAREEEPHCDPFSNISLLALVLPSAAMRSTAGLSDGWADSQGMTQQEKERIARGLIASPLTDKTLAWYTWTVAVPRHVTEGECLIFIDIHVVGGSSINLQCAGTIS